MKLVIWKKKKRTNKQNYDFLSCLKSNQFRGVKNKYRKKEKRIKLFSLPNSHPNHS